MKIINKKSCRGFSLAELALSVAITVILLLVVFSIATTASDALDSTNASVQRDKNADEFLDYISRDLESIVIVEGSDDAYLSIGVLAGGADWSKNLGPASSEMTNNGGLCFYTAATDRYNGDVNTSSDGGGDVSCVSYTLYWRNYVQSLTGNTAGWETNARYGAFRSLVYPDMTYKEVLGEADVHDRMYTGGVDRVLDVNNSGVVGSRHLIASNIFEMSYMFEIEYTDIAAAKKVAKVVFIKPLALDSEKSLNIGKVAQITGIGFKSDCYYSGTTSIDAAVASGAIANVKAKSVTVIVNVMDSNTQTLIAKRETSSPLTRVQVLAKCRAFSRTVQLP